MHHFSRLYEVTLRIFNLLELATEEKGPCSKRPSLSYHGYPSLHFITKHQTKNIVHIFKALQFAPELNYSSAKQEKFPSWQYISCNFCHSI